MALVNKKTLQISLLLVGSVVLAACSSKPSPWSEASSPWDSRQQQAEAEPVVAMESSEPVVMDQAPAEPMDMAMMGTEPMPGDAMADAPVNEAMYAAEPVAAEPAMGGLMAGGLASQPADYFVVQVVASSTMQGATDYAKKNQISDQWIAETTVGGKVWYVLMLGVYPNKFEADQALAAVQGMDTQPWVRSVGSVQSVMSKM